MILAVFDNSGIDSRYFCVPPEWFSSEKSFSEKNQTYIDWACKLGSQASVECLNRAGISANDIDHIIYVSTTGLATPSIDARLINILNLRQDITRTPIWGLGCLGGAAGLSRATDYVKAFPDSNVLLVVVELCGLTFLFNDFSKSNFIATALFADGAAAVLLSGSGAGPEIVDTQSQIWPDSLDIMGWNFMDEGLQVIFSKSIPDIVNKFTYDQMTAFLSKHGLGLADMEYFLIHPGGSKVIESYRQALHLDSNELTLAEGILREYGNMSAVTVLYILDRYLRESYRKDSNYGLLTALGPGFSSETLLLKN